MRSEPTRNGPLPMTDPISWIALSTKMRMSCPCYWAGRRWMECGPMPKNLLVVGRGSEAVPGLERAKQMGLHLVVSDMNPEAPGFAVADDRLLASTYDIPATVAAARRYHSEVRRFDGVMCIASD